MKMKMKEKGKLHTKGAKTKGERDAREVNYGITWNRESIIFAGVREFCFRTDIQTPQKVNAIVKE
jgi:hypothetical protein